MVVSSSYNLQLLCVGVATVAAIIGRWRPAFAHEGGEKRLELKQRAGGVQDAIGGRMCKSRGERVAAGAKVTWTCGEGLGTLAGSLQGLWLHVTNSVMRQ